MTGVQGPLSLHTASGNIDVEGTPAAPWNLAASSGDIRVVLSGSPAFDFEASSSSGRIRVGRPGYRLRTPVPPGAAGPGAGWRPGCGNLDSVRQYPDPIRWDNLSCSPLSIARFRHSRTLARNVLL